MELSLAQLRSASEAQFVNAGAWSNGAMEAMRVNGWSIDSRTAGKGDVFFAIKGERHDGHRFVEDVFKRGISAAVVSEAVDAPGPLFRVSDTVAALQKVARFARRKWNRPVVAVTGSAGKTTTKDIIAAFLATKFRVGKTAGNLNNHIGLPLSLLRLSDAAEVGVIEIGMNHSGEIRDLSAIAEPQIGVVTNIGYAHIESFESIDGIAAAKRELIEALPESGIAVLNADDARVVAFREGFRGRCVTYGFSEQADIRATDVQTTAEAAVFKVGDIRFRSSFTGRHGILNLLAGLAVAQVFEIEPATLVDAMAQLTPGPMRGERTVWRGIVILNDSYNSNPEAARSMIDLLRAQPATRRIAVLGEMLELGRLAEDLHRDLGTYVAEAGINVLVGVRGVSRFMVEQAKKTGLDDHAAFFFEQPEAAGEFLRTFVRPGDAILFKGSRGTHIERALATMEA